MKTKIAGAMILLAGTATVFAATHVTLNKEQHGTNVSGIAAFVDGIDKKLTMEMEFVGLQPGNIYLARLENTSCRNLFRQSTSLSNGLQVAMFVESNQFGSYSTVMKGLPSDAKDAKSVALYKDVESNDGVNTVYCINLG